MIGKSYRNFEGFMKKNISVFTVIFALFFIFFAEEVYSAGFEMGIGSGYVFYGDSETKDLVSAMNSENFNRFIIGGEAGFFIPLTDILVFTADSEIMSDLFWKGSRHCYFLDYAFNGGIKMYPGLKGLAFSVAYTLGRRTSFIKMYNQDSIISSTSWGNGFKFAVDYDIKYGKDGICPVIGAYWRHVPRGNSFSDNTLSIYLKLFFR